MSMSQFNRWLKRQGVTKGPRCYWIPCTGEIVSGDPTLGGVGTDKQEPRLRVTITTRKRDRHGDILEPGGAQISAFLKNPVVLWAHEYRSLPIGRATSLVRDGNALKAEILFAPTQFAQEVRDLYAKNFLRAWSVGFLPVEWEVIEDEEGKFAGYHVRSWELIELSAVPVPANPEALTNALEKGLVKEPALSRSLRDAVAADHRVIGADCGKTASEAEASASKREPGRPDAARPPEMDPSLLAQALAVKLMVRLRACLGDAVAREIRRRQGRLD